jgi:hypothetical protein
MDARVRKWGSESIEIRISLASGKIKPIMRALWMH